MTKDELIKALEDCVKTEESAIPIYTKHISNTLFLSEFLQSEKDSILKTLDVLDKESHTHKKIFDGLVEKVKKADKDVY